MEKNTRNLLSLILKSTPSHSGSYHILDGGDFLKPLVIKSNLNIENLNSKNIKPRFHLELLRELLAKGYVDNDVIEDLHSLLIGAQTRWKRKRREKKEITSKGSMNPISGYFHKKASTSQGKSQNGSDDSHDELDDDDDNEDDDGDIK